MNSASAKRFRCLRGFTLVEVLVSLAIVAISIVMLLETLLGNTARIIYVQDKAFASWIGFNRITEFRLQETLPDPGDDDGEVEMAGRTWRWESEISQTPVDNLMRVEVSVFDVKYPDDSLVTAIGFLGLPTPRSNAPAWVFSNSGSRSGSNSDDENNGGE